jgi:predicted  nucleic acid-binding Zn-ribbon protein
MAAAENELKASQKRVTDSEAALKREELLRASQELEVASNRAKAARFRQQLDSAQNSAQAAALQHQIQFAEQEIARLEDAELASMEVTESVELERVKARELAAKLTETVGLIRARIGEQDLEFREQLAALKLEREALRAELVLVQDGAQLAHFDRIAGMRGTGLARAVGQQCSGCRMGIRPQVWNQLRDGLVMNCESCSRILYFDPVMDAPQPKSARSVDPETALGGVSIRRKQAGV